MEDVISRKLLIKMNTLECKFIIWKFNVFIYMLMNKIFFFFLFFILFSFFMWSMGKIKLVRCKIYGEIGII